MISQNCDIDNFFPILQSAKLCSLSTLDFQLQTMTVQVLSFKQSQNQDRDI